MREHGVRARLLLLPGPRLDYFNAHHVVDADCPRAPVLSRSLGAVRIGVYVGTAGEFKGQTGAIVRAIVGAEHTGILRPCYNTQLLLIPAFRRPELMAGLLVQLNALYA
jgi:hypothetical protein